MMVWTMFTILCNFVAVLESNGTRLQSGKTVHLVMARKVCIAGKELAKKKWIEYPHLDTNSDGCSFPLKIIFHTFFSDRRPFVPF